MSLKSRITVFLAALLGFLLLIAGLSAYGSYKLERILAYVTGPAWDTADGAMETTIGVEAEMNWIYHRLLGMPQKDEQLARVRAMSESAFARLLSANIMDEKHSASVKKSLDDYRAAFGRLQGSFDQYLEAKNALDKDADKMIRLGEALERMGDAQVEAIDPNLAISWSNGLKTRWDAADGGMESSIGFLTQLYHLTRLRDAEDTQAVVEEINAAIGFQKDAVESMMATGVFDVAMSEFGVGLVSAIYRDLMAKHHANVKTLITATLNYREQLRLCEIQTRELLGLLEDFEERGDQAVESQITEVETQQSLMMGLMIFMVLAVVVALVGAYWCLHQWIIAPVQQLERRLVDITQGEGNLKQRLLVNADDELGRVGKEINHLIEMLQKLVAGIAHQSNQIVDKIQFNKNVALSTYNHAQSAAKNAQSLASASGQVSVAANAIASACTAASDAVQSAKQHTFASRDITEATTRGMARIKQQVRELSERITQLRNSAEKIGEIVSVIGGISDQTNLLALNAAIEAARAGEQGRGFAVVADEVRTLAQRTSQSTLEIADVIKSIQGLSQGAFELIHSCVEEVESKSADSQSAAQALHQLTGIVDGMSLLIAQAATAAEEQSTVMGDISSRVSVIAEDAAGVDSEARTQIACADELTTNAQHLKTALARFHY
jgi:methyl-accepting chemotaxis protein